MTAGASNADLCPWLAEGCLAEADSAGMMGPATSRVAALLGSTEGITKVPTAGSGWADGIAGSVAFVVSYVVPAGCPWFPSAARTLSGNLRSSGMGLARSACGALSGTAAWPVSSPAWFAESGRCCVGDEESCAVAPLVGTVLRKPANLVPGISLDPRTALPFPATAGTSAPTCNPCALAGRLGESPASTVRPEERSL